MNIIKKDTNKGHGPRGSRERRGKRFRRGGEGIGTGVLGRRSFYAPKILGFFCRGWRCVELPAEGLAGKKAGAAQRMCPCAGILRGKGLLGKGNLCIRGG